MSCTSITLYLWVHDSVIFFEKKRVKSESIKDTYLISKWEVQSTDRPFSGYSNGQKCSSPYPCRMTKKMWLSFAWQVDRTWNVVTSQIFIHHLTASSRSCDSVIWWKLKIVYREIEILKSRGKSICIGVLVLGVLRS